MKLKMIFFALTLLSIRGFAQTDSIRNATTPPYVRNSVDDSLNHHPAGDAMVRDRDKTYNQNHDIKNDQKNDMNYGTFDDPMRRDSMMRHGTTDKWHSDGVMMRSGHVIMVKDGHETRMDREITLDNGTRITSNGTVVTKDGTESKLKEGQHMDMSGMIVPMQKGKSRTGTTPSDRSMEHDNMKDHEKTKTSKNKRMYLVPDSTVKKDSLH